jgi:hypothetical protein
LPQSVGFNELSWSILFLLMPWVRTILLLFTDIAEQLSEEK